MKYLVKRRFEKLADYLGKLEGKPYTEEIKKDIIRKVNEIFTEKKTRPIFS